MYMKNLEQELKENAYPGRGIVIGESRDGKTAVTAYFIMGRSSNSRNRVFVEDGNGIRTQAFDPAKLEDPSLIIYAPVRVLGNKTIVTTVTRRIPYEGMDHQLTLSSPCAAVICNRMHQTTHHVFPAFSMWKIRNTAMPCPF